MDNSKINEGVRPKSSIAASAITMCVSTKTIEKFIDVVEAYDKYSTQPTSEMADYVYFSLQAIALEVKIQQACVNRMKSNGSENGTVSTG